MGIHVCDRLLGAHVPHIMVFNIDQGPFVSPEVLRVKSPCGAFVSAHYKTVIEFV